MFLKHERGRRKSNLKVAALGKRKIWEYQKNTAGLKSLEAFHPTIGPLEHRLKDHVGMSGARWEDSFITAKVGEIKENNK